MSYIEAISIPAQVGSMSCSEVRRSYKQASFHHCPQKYAFNEPVSVKRRYVQQPQLPRDNLRFRCGSSYPTMPQTAQYQKQQMARSENIPRQNLYSLNPSCNYKLASFQRNCTNNTMGHDLNYPSFHNKSVSQVQHYNNEMFARTPAGYLTPSPSPENNTSLYFNKYGETLCCTPTDAFQNNNLHNTNGSVGSNPSLATTNLYNAKTISSARLRPPVRKLSVQQRRKPADKNIFSRPQNRSKVADTQRLTCVEADNRFYIAENFPFVGQQLPTTNTLLRPSNQRATQMPFTRSLNRTKVGSYQQYKKKQKNTRTRKHLRQLSTSAENDNIVATPQRSSLVSQVIHVSNSTSSEVQSLQWNQNSTSNTTSLQRTCDHKPFVNLLAVKHGEPFPQEYINNHGTTRIASQSPENLQNTKSKVNEYCEKVGEL